MIGSRAWFSLMRRNATYRRRHWLSTVLEMALPIAFVGILIAIKNALGKNAQTKVVPPSFPDAVKDAYRPLSFRDFVLTLQSKRYCTKALNVSSLVPQGTTSPTFLYPFDITGMPVQGYDWQNPFVRCDNNQCQHEGQNAQDFCEYGFLGVAPQHSTQGQQRTQAFVDWLYQEYPILVPSASNNNNNNNSALPFDFNFVQTFSSEKAMEDYVSAADYGTSGKPKVIMGIVWQGDASNDYQYSLRQNQTGYNIPSEGARPGTVTTPPTNQVFDHYAPNDKSCPVVSGAPFLGPRQQSCTGQYLYNGIITMQKLVGDFILADSGANTQVADNGIQFVPFPTKQYQTGGFFGQIAGTYHTRRTDGLWNGME